MPRPIADILAALEDAAPSALAEPWDKVGLLVAGDGRAVTRALLAIDVVPEVLDEARLLGAELVIGYHPLLFKPLERLDGSTWQARVALDAVRAGIAVHSPHTALDAVAGGVNDWLVECVAGGAGEARGVEALQPARARGRNTHKLVAFVPESALDEVRAALAEAEAGRIGLYTHCSFSSSGEGTFFGGEGSNPAAGSAGRLERVRELRLEMAFAARDLPAVVAALRAAHPYEEPAFDIVALEQPPAADRRVGAGRVADLAKPATADEVAARLAPALCADTGHDMGLDAGHDSGHDSVFNKGHTPAGPAILRSRQAGATARTHARFAVCAGSGASLLDAAAAKGATLFVTGELSHHEVLRAHALGLEVLLAGHTNTERGYLPRLASRLASDRRAQGVEFRVSRADREALR